MSEAPQRTSSIPRSLRFACSRPFCGAKGALWVLRLLLFRSWKGRLEMGINRRDAQVVESPCADVEIRVMSDSSTGSKMMTVLEVRLEPGGATPYQANVSHEESWFIYSGDVSFVEGSSAVFVDFGGLCFGGEGGWDVGGECGFRGGADRDDESGSVGGSRGDGGAGGG